MRCSEMQLLVHESFTLPSVSSTVMQLLVGGSVGVCVGVFVLVAVFVGSDVRCVMVKVGV